MKIQRTTTLGEIHDHFSQKAVAFALGIHANGLDSQGFDYLIGALERINGTSKGDIVRMDDDELKTFSANTIVVVEDKCVHWEIKHPEYSWICRYELRFYGGEPMEIA